MKYHRVIDFRTDISTRKKMNPRETLVDEKHGKGSSFPYICRTCLNTIELGETFTFVNDLSKVKYFENLRISYMIEKSVPELVSHVELDLDITHNPIICNTCYKMLWYTYLFKLRCFQTEEKIFVYLEKNKLNLGDKIDIQQLRNEKCAEETIINYNVTTVDNMTAQSDVICISDSESTDDGDNDDDCRQEKKGEEKDARVVGCDAIRDLYGVADVPMNGKSTIGQRNVFPCQECNYKGSRLDLLKRHVRNCHAAKVMKNYNCHICLYTTFRKSNLKRHELMHGGVQPFVCGICERTFTERHMLKVHMYKHSDVNIIPNGTANRATNGHIRFQRYEQKTERLCCSHICFDHRREVNLVVVQDGTMTNSSVYCIQGKPLYFRCGEVGCKAAFARECDLSVHIVSHMNYSPNICKECNKAFLTKDQLERHKHKYKH